MSFLYPSFLWALLAIAIPIIVHLFYFRRFKKIYFTNVRFLREVKEETSSRTRLKHLLVLCSRILAVIFLVLAFAQPFIPKKDTEIKRGIKAVSLFIDNSFSMSSLSQDVPLLEKAKQRAREIVAAYNVEDEFQILTNDFEARHQRLVSKEDALGWIDEVSISPEVKELSRTLTRQKQALNTTATTNKVSYLISDFQKNITDFEGQQLQDTTVDVSIIPLQSVRQRNISIDSCWFEAPVQMLNQTNPLIVKVRNLSDENVEDVRLSLRLDGQVKPIGSLSVNARSEALDTVNITLLHTGWHQAELNITDFPVQFDDTYYFAFNVAERINVLAINEALPNRYLDAVFERNDYFALENQLAGRLDYSRLPRFQLIVLNELKAISSGLASALHQYTRDGGNVLIFPHPKADLSSYKNFSTLFQANELIDFDSTAHGVSYINTEEFIFRDVFENTQANLKLPETRGNFKLTRYNNRGEEILLRYRDGSTYLGKYQTEKGNLYLCAAPLEEAFNSLSRSGEIFVPMLYKMALATGKQLKIGYTIGADEILETENRITSGETVYKLKGNNQEFIPEQKNIGAKTILSTNDQIKTAGFYELFLQEDTSLAVFAYNYDRKESALDYYSERELEELTGGNMDIIQANTTANLEDLIGERNRGVVLWRWCLILALAFLLVEILLLRLWKT